MVTIPIAIGTHNRHKGDAIEWSLKSVIILPVSYQLLFWSSILCSRRIEKDIARFPLSLFSDAPMVYSCQRQLLFRFSFHCYPSLNDMRPPYPYFRVSR